MLRRFAVSVLAFLWVLHSGFAGEIKPIDLKTFVGYSPFDQINADWLVPRGNHVFDGVPWKIDGVILLYCTNSIQREKPARTNVSDIPVAQKFEKLHLLAASQQYVRDGVPIAKVHLNYADGTRASLDVRYGFEVRYYQGSWHTSDRSPRNDDVHLAWHAQFEGIAAKDSYLRLYHVPLANPSPEKEVQTISLESTKTASALMVAAMSVGPANAAALPNDSLGKAPFPDLQPRTGMPATGEGFVFTEEGKPISGAVVRVVAAREYGSDEPRDGRVGAETRTDAKGHFAIPNLADNCAYHVLIAAEDYQSVVYRGLDAKSDPIQVRLQRATNSAAKYVVHARVLGPDGKPLAFAQIERDGVGYNGGTSWGGRQDVTDHAVTGTNGEFVLTSNTYFDRVQVHVTAAGLAPQMEWLAVTNRVQDIELGVGATIRGRVLDLDGKPLPHVTLGISGSDRNSEVYAGHFRATTDTDGTFTFRHVPPLKSWQFYGVLSSFKKYGALSMRAIQSPRHSDSKNLGDFQIVEGLHLAGWVKTRNGDALPDKLILRLGIESAWDSQQVTVDKDGKFVFEGLYPGQVNLSLVTDGWNLSGLNRSLSIWNPWEMSGLIEKNKDDLLVMIQKGQREYNYDSSNGSLPPSDNPFSKPLAGAENMETMAIVLAGSVVDDSTGKPITKCRIVPGYKPSASAWGFARPKPATNVLQKLLKPLVQKPAPNFYDAPFWMPARAEESTNGTFSMAFVPLQSTPMLRIEADGYEPVVTEPIVSSTNGMVIRLSRGAGPSGVVLLADGKPAEGVSVFYAINREQFALDGRGLVSHSQRRERQFKTGVDGRFAFPSAAGAGRIFVANPGGYAEIPVQGKDAKFDVHLKPWAAISGALVRSNGLPASGVKLGLTLYNNNNWNGTDAHVYYGTQTVTDTNGFFLFTNVPPRRVQVQRIVPQSANSWSYVTQTWLDVQPGITNDVGKVPFDTPPADSIVNQLKHKLGIE